MAALHASHDLKQSTTETNGINMILFGEHNRTLGPYSAPIHRIQCSMSISMMEASIILLSIRHGPVSRNLLTACCVPELNVPPVHNRWLYLPTGSSVQPTAALSVIRQLCPADWGSICQMGAPSSRLRFYLSKDSSVQSTAALSVKRQLCPADSCCNRVAQLVGHDLLLGRVRVVVTPHF
jgi:hypothetical protein